MPRPKSTDGRPPPRPGSNALAGNWLAGAMIGAVIATMATQAMLLGAGTAMTCATIRRG